MGPECPAMGARCHQPDEFRGSARKRISTREAVCGPAVHFEAPRRAGPGKRRLLDRHGSQAPQVQNGALVAAGSVRSFRIAGDGTLAHLADQEVLEGVELYRSTGF